MLYPASTSVSKGSYFKCPEHHYGKFKKSSASRLSLSIAYNVDNFMITCYKTKPFVCLFCVCACVCFPPHHSLQGISYFLFVKLQDKKMIHKHNSFLIFVMWNLIIRVKGKKQDGIPASL